MSIPVCLIVALTQPGLWRAVAWVSWAAQMAALMLTYSRGAWLGWCASMFILVVLTKRWKTLVVMIAIVMACMVTLPALRQRVTTVIQPRSDQALSERLEMMTDAFRVGIQNPLLGAGYDRGRVKAALRSNYQDTAEAKVPMSHTHNVYLELFAAIGLLGLGIFVWLIMDAFHRLLGNEFAPSESERTIRFLIVASWTAAIVTGLGDVPFYHHETRVFFFTLLAWIHLYVRKARSGAQVHHWA
jgi:O-antigen ligase